MNERIAAFCWRAVKRGILTPGQCLVLRELFTEKATLEDCVEFIEKNSLVDEKKIKALRLQLKASPREVTLSEGDRLPGEEGLPEEQPPARPVFEPDPGLDWFCHLAVKRGLLTREICLCLIADMDTVVDLLSFAQAVVDTGLCRDLDAIQELTDEALEQWARGKKPPTSIFERGETPA